MKNSDLCPCHSNLPYESCCKPFHKGSFPDKAEQLMRSRYSAYALKNADYIIKATHKESPYYQKNTSVWKKEILVFCKSTDFLNLEILKSIDQGKLAYVTFIATLLQKDLDVTFTEKSTFKKMGKKWLYVAGIKKDGRHFDLD